MTFRDALHDVCNGALIKILVPRLAMGLTARWRRVRAAYDEFEVCLVYLIFDIMRGKVLMHNRYTC